MKIEHIFTKKELLKSYSLLTEVYPSLTLEEYSSELDIMLGNNYSQLIVIDEGQIIGLTGVWIGSKLWCGKYMELDNVVVSETYRSKGIGKLLFDEANKIASAEKVSMISLDSYTTNFKAHKFFYNEGFSPKGFHFVKLLDKSKVR